MRAAVFHKAGEPLAIEDIPYPEPAPDQIVIKVARCGVCGTDLHATSGHGRHLPDGAQIGHEFAGEVVEVGRAVERIKVGDKIAGMPVVGCGACDYCRSGIGMLCGQWVSYGKALAEYCRLPERGAVLLPSSVSMADGALIEPLAVARRGVCLAAPPPDARVLVIGPGPIGLGVVFWLRRLGVRNIVVLASSGRRRRLAELMGAEHFIIEGDDAEARIEAALGGPPAFIFEAAGMPGVVARALGLIRRQGYILALGFCTTAEAIVPAAALMKDVTLRFSITYGVDDYVACADALVEDADRARAMVTDVVPLRDFPEAFERFRQGRSGGGKLLCDPWS